MNFITRRRKKVALCVLLCVCHATLCECVIFSSDWLPDASFIR